MFALKKLGFTEKTKKNTKKHHKVQFKVLEKEKTRNICVDNVEKLAIM